MLSDKQRAGLLVWLVVAAAAGVGGYLLAGKLTGDATALEQKHHPHPVAATATARVMTPKTGGAELAGASASGAARSGAGKHVAVTHTLTVAADGASLRAVFDRTVALCEQAGCEITSSEYRSAEASYESGGSGGTLSARIPPSALDQFLRQVGTGGTVLSHRRDAEDRSQQVIDAEARVRNLSGLRDRLRALLRERTASVQQVLEVERELANVQIQLDAAHDMRRLLAAQTEMVAVHLHVVETGTARGTGAVTQALDTAGERFLESVAGVVTVAAMALPWLLCAAPVAAFAYVRRRMRRKQSASSGAAGRA